MQSRKILAFSTKQCKSRYIKMLGRSLLHPSRRLGSWNSHAKADMHITNISESVKQTTAMQNNMHLYITVKLTLQ